MSLIQLLWKTPCRGEADGRDDELEKKHGHYRSEVVQLSMGWMNFPKKRIPPPLGYNVNNKVEPHLS